MVLVAAAAGWFSGFALVGPFDGHWWLAPGAWLIAGAVVSVRRPRPALVLVAAAGVALVGGWRYHEFESRAPPPLLAHVGKVLVVRGTVDPARDPGLTTARYTVSVSGVDTGEGWEPSAGNVLVALGEYERLAPGALVEVHGKLAEPPVFEGFDYRAWLLRRGTVGSFYRPRIVLVSGAAGLDPRRLAAAIGERLDLALARSLPEPEASLAAGVLVGRDGAMPDAVKEDFRRAGLAHLVAVSGANVALVAALVFAVSSPVLGRRTAMVPAVAAVVAYTLLSGGSWSVVRASGMAVVFLLGEYLGRPRSSLDALAAVAVVITAIRPGAAGDAGFQLSAAATAGLIAFAPWIEFGLAQALGPLGRALVPRPVLQVTALTLSASLATLPVTWASFGQVSLIGPVANVLAEPLFATAFALSALAAAAGAAWPTAGWAVGLAAYYPLHGLVVIGSVLGEPAWAAIGVEPVGARRAVVAGSLLAAAAWPTYRYLPPDTGPPSRPSRLLRAGWRGLGWGAALAVGGWALFAWSLGPARGPGKLLLEVLDVGQGDALLLVTPHGRQVLVDGGPSGLRAAQELGPRMPHWDRTLDAVVLTHPQQDHIGGLPGVLLRYEAGLVLDSGATNTSATYARYAALAPQRVTTTAPAAFTLDGVLFEVLWPPAGEAQPKNLNDASVVLRVSYRGAVVLLTGDLEAAAGARMAAASDVSASILKVPHHGSRTTDPAFIEATGASVAVISVGAGNRYGHPAPATLAALDGMVVARTDLHGAVTVATDGKTIEVSARGLRTSLPVRRPLR